MPKPLSIEELGILEARQERWLASAVSPISLQFDVPRLFATIAARDADIARLRESLSLIAMRKHSVTLQEPVDWEEVANIFEHLEDLGSVSKIGPDFYAIASIAISLKRLADALEQPKIPSNIATHFVPASQESRQLPYRMFFEPDTAE